MEKAVVITGVTRGIGKQCAIDLVNEGYFVIGLYNKSDNSAKELESFSTMIKTYKCDISDYKSVNTISAEILSKYKNIYAVINNAGVAKTSLFTDVTEEDFDNIFNINIKGVFAVTKSFLPNLINRKQGRIINISSIWGVCGGSCEVVYSASKAAVIGMTKALAQEVGPSGITVNSISPGVIETDMINNLSQEDKKALADDTALMRNGTPKDISRVIKFLLSDDASFITGQNIIVDGGMI